jgi:Uma2 family endonuclease
MHKVMTKRGRLSFSAYSQTPADGKRYEYLGGEVYVSPTPSFAHQFTARELFLQLERYFDAPHGMPQVFFAPLAVILHDTPPADAEIAVPDLLVVEDQSTLAQRGVNGAPLVSVEIISPSKPSLDRKVKFERYAANSVQHYWMIDPIAETMECYRLVEAQYVLHALGTGDEKLDVPAFPGLRIDLSLLWDRLDSSKA